MNRIIIGMSGGVDSAVAASILIEKGYEVEGLFMKNWEEESEFCSAEKDYKDALQACEVLGIPINSVNFAKEYFLLISEKATSNLFIPLFQVIAPTFKKTK